MNQAGASGRPAILAICEAVLYAQDLEACRRFYAEILMLPVVSENGPISLTFRISDDQVLIVFDPRRSSQPGRPVPSHGCEGSGHAAFRIAQQDLDAWRAHLARHACPIEQEVAWDPDGHSIYLRDPAGNSVELITRDIWPVGR